MVSQQAFDTAVTAESGASSCPPAESGASSPASPCASPQPGSCPEPSAKQAESEKSFAKCRSRRKGESLTSFFGLPANEACIDHFNCALKHRILLHGQLYIFPHHLCFYSNIFGYTKTRVLPLKDITSVRKRKRYGLPNALEVTCRGKAEVYTSFINRKEAHSLIMEHWRQCSDYAKLFGDGSSDLASPNAADDGTPRSLDGRLSRLSAASAPAGVDGHAEVTTTSQPGSSRKQEAQAGPQSRLSRTSLGNWSGAASASEPTTAANSVQDSESGEEGEASWPVEQGVPPELPEAMSPVAEGAWPFPVSEGLEQFFSDASGFFKDWHGKRGDQNVRLGKWGQPLGSAVGRVRELHFDQPMTGALKGLPMAPKFARCHQTQRLRIFAGDHLVFETTQVMTGIPMADLFKVEGRWDITPTIGDPSSCQVRTFLSIPFSRSSMWKGTIERTTRAAVRESYQDFIDKAATQHSPRLQAPPTPTLRIPVSGFARRASSQLSGRLPSGAGGRGASGRVSRDFARKRTASRNLDRLLSQRDRAGSDAVSDVTGIIQRVDPAYKSDFLRVLRAGLDAEEAASEGTTPVSARLGPSWGTSMSQGGIGSATGLVDRQPVWQLRLPSLSTALLAAAVLLLIALQVYVVMRLTGPHERAMSLSHQPLVSLSGQVAELQQEVESLKQQLAQLQQVRRL